MHVCRVVKQQTWLKDLLPYDNVSLVPNLNTRITFVEAVYNTSSSSPATPSLKALTNELKSVSDWHSLGVNLDLKHHQLKEIEKSYRGDDKRCKTEVLGCWLDSTPNPTWEAVAEALYLMDAHAVTTIIRRKYIISTTTRTEGTFYRLFL